MTKQFERTSEIVPSGERNHLDVSRQQAKQSEKRQLLSPDTLDFHDEDLLKPTGFGYNEKGILYEIDFPNRKRATLKNFGAQRFAVLIRYINDRIGSDLPVDHSIASMSSQERSPDESQSSNRQEHVVIDIDSPKMIEP